MPRPAVGSAPRPCAACGGLEYAGAPGCARCGALVDAILEDAWAAFLRRWDARTPQDADDLAAMVAAEPDRHDWRVVDAALDRLTCAACAAALGSGPLGCRPCDLAHGFRYAAVETDRPGVTPGNEHAVRVNVSVVRRPHVTSAGELLVRRLFLPYLLVGLLPTTAEAQRVSALLKGASAAHAAQVVARTMAPSVPRS